jgi:hypothetical protein
MAAGKKMQDESEARRCLLAARREGQSAGKWARAHRIDGRSLHVWRMNLERGGGTARLRPRKPKASTTARTLVELVASPSGVELTGRDRYVLEVGGARLEFDDNASAGDSAPRARGSALMRSLIGGEPYLTAGSGPSTAWSPKRVCPP